MKFKWYLFFLFVFALLGYGRDYFFVNLNNILFIVYYHRPSIMPVPKVMAFFQDFSYDTLYYSKYIYTLLCTLLYYLATYYALKKIAKAAILVKMLNYTYVVILALAGLSMIYGYLFHNRLQSDEYTLSRWLMGIAQSPIICLILLASEKLYLRSFKKENAREEQIADQ